MLVLDQVKRSDPRLRWIAAGILLGLLILLAGLWYVQVVSRYKYQNSLRVQSFRNVRLPAARGKIFDRHGATLVENQPRFVVNLYLEELREKFTFEYTNSVRKDFILTEKRTPAYKERLVLQEIARYRAVSNIVWQLSSAVLPQPLILNPHAFKRHYESERAMPLTVLEDLTMEQVGLFTEKAAGLPGVELEAESFRHYPYGALAAHAIGYVQRTLGEDEQQEDDDDYLFRYRLPDFLGKTGIEKGFDLDLRGRPGGKAILVNNLGYRQKDEVWLPPSPGKNIYLTLDLEIQKTAEKALLSSGKDTRGAAVVLDVRNGDVLALASTPSYDLNMFIRGKHYPKEEWDRLQDEELLVQYNRALQGTYHPGSVFKIIVGLAAFEANIMTPEDQVTHPGYYMLGRRRIEDLAPPGSYDFKEAFKYSCNSYFIENGRKAGVDQIINLGTRFGLGDRTGVVPTPFERPGYFPKTGNRVKEDGSTWKEGDTANLCIGQGEITVTPMQMALMTAAVANGGILYKPRLVMHLEDQELKTISETIPKGQVERDIGINKYFLEVVRKAMLADVEEPGGTGKAAFLPGMGICGKTGTAQVRKRGRMDHVTWFVSFAPFDAPKYAVVVMVESGSSGGGTCAPKAKEIYKTIQKLEQKAIEQNRARSLASN